MLCKTEVFTAVAVKNAVFWDVTPSNSWRNGHFGGTSVLQESSHRLQVYDRNSIRIRGKNVSLLRCVQTGRGSLPAGLLSNV
jgi:hypothetical protein